METGRDGLGCVFISSAGNIPIGHPDKTSITFPGNVSEVIAVGNLKENGEISEYSCYGPNMCVVAPGTNIMSPVPGNKYNDSATGTSCACPHVAGIAALILQRNPYLTWQEVRDIIINTAVKVGPLGNGKNWDEHYGYGLVNAYQAVINTPRPPRY